VTAPPSPEATRKFPPDNWGLDRAARSSRFLHGPVPVYGTGVVDMLWFVSGGLFGLHALAASLRRHHMSLGMILIIILIIFLLGGFSGRFGGYGYGMGHSGMGLGGVVLIVLLILLLLGKL
jgi:hypothetical protein